jgi:hypothetical protein
MNAQSYADYRVHAIAWYDALTRREPICRGVSETQAVLNPLFPLPLRVDDAGHDAVEMLADGSVEFVGNTNTKRLSGMVSRNTTINDTIEKNETMRNLHVMMRCTASGAAAADRQLQGK